MSKGLGDCDNLSEDFDSGDWDEKDSPMWMAPNPKYTVEEMGRILNGLASGRPANHRPMSDREFERRYDPVAAEHKEMVGAIKELVSEFKLLVEERQERPAPRQREPAAYVPRAAAPKPARGPVDL